MVTIWNKQTGEPRKLDSVDAKEYLASAPETWTNVDPSPPAVVATPLAPMTADEAHAFASAANTFTAPRNPSDPEGTAWRKPQHVGQGDGVPPVPESGVRRIRGGRTGKTRR